MRTLLFVHGWGFTGGVWTAVANRLPEFRREFVDLGFRGHDLRPTPDSPIVVGHSMGFAWALANIARPWAGAVAVNAFPRFTRCPDFVSGVAPRLVERMVSRFADAPAAVAAEFLSRCGVEDPEAEGLKPEPMGAALSWLASCDERAALAALDCPLVALAGTRDPIVPEPMSREGFAAHPLVLADGGGHLLPLTHPEWVAQQIRLFASGLA
ncbi:MAG: alpha/beta fold hydrolase [Solirubrobacterales bacterium]